MSSNVSAQNEDETRAPIRLTKEVLEEQVLRLDKTPAEVSKEFGVNADSVRRNLDLHKILWITERHSKKNSKSSQPEGLLPSKPITNKNIQEEGSKPRDEDEGVSSKKQKVNSKVPITMVRLDKDKNPQEIFKVLLTEDECNVERITSLKATLHSS